MPINNEFPPSYLTDHRGDIRLAVALYEEHLKFGIKARDAIHAATLKNNGFVQIISADKHFDYFSFFQRIDPISYVSQN